MTQPCDTDLWVMKWRSAWPIFQGPVILPYILKTIWCMYIILLEYESVWPDVWPQIKCTSLWPIFHGPAIVHCALKTICVWTSLFGIMNQYDPTHDLKINVGHCDLYFMVQWFCVVSWRLIWCMNINLGDFGSVWPDVWPKNKCMSLWPIFHGPLILPYISKTIWWRSVIFLDNEKVWPKPWPQNKYRSTWPNFMV